MKKLFSSLLLIAGLAFAASAAPMCITNVSLSIAGTANFGGAHGILHASAGETNVYTGLALISDCSEIGACLGTYITVTPNPGSPGGPENPPTGAGCQPYTTIIGYLRWQCTPACDPAQQTHELAIVFPANASTLSFHICESRGANCQLFPACIEATICGVSAQ